MKATRVLETCLYVDDLEAAKTFYADVLGLDFYAEIKGRHAFFRCGNAMFLLFNPEATSTPDPKLGVPGHGARGPGHAAFSMDEAEIGHWREHLAQCNVPIEEEVTWPGGGFSLYFRDPAGNSVELATPKIWRLA